MTSSPTREVLERVEPSPALLKAVLRTKHLMDPKVLELARKLVAAVIEELMRKLATEVRMSFSGTRLRRPSQVRLARNFDVKRTLRGNLGHYQPEERKLYIEDAHFFTRSRRHVDNWQVILLVDQSGSMVSSVIHSAVTAACLWGLPGVRTHLVAFDTSVVDLTSDVTDPVELLMKVQLGGGTDIARAVDYAGELVIEPAPHHRGPDIRPLRGRQRGESDPRRPLADRAGLPLPRPVRAGRGRQPGFQPRHGRTHGEPRRPRRRDDPGRAGGVRRGSGELMTARADLLALTEDALVSLTNRGLYKRAAKEVAAGTGPAIAEDADAVRGTFPDGVVCALPPGGLEAADCTCGASGACRHVVAVVLAYQAVCFGRRGRVRGVVAGGVHRRGAGGAARQAELRHGPPPPRDRVPGARARGDRDGAGAVGRAAELLGAFPGAARSGVRAQRRAGHEGGGRARGVGVAGLGGSGGGREADRHFAVGGTDEVQAGSDASAEVGDANELTADAAASSSPESAALVGRADGAPSSTPEALASAVDLAADIFLTGVSNLAAGFTPRLARVRRDLDAANLRWPLLAAEDLADQLAAHAERAARHQQVLVADLLAELVARARVAGSSGGQPRSRVLGTERGGRGGVAPAAADRARLPGAGRRRGSQGSGVPGRSGGRRRAHARRPLSGRLRPAPIWSGAGWPGAPSACWPAATS